MRFRALGKGFPLAAILIALGWAAFTSHVWEDYYITYRASKNLATGQGLVFTPGEHVHSFTSPLGVLLPAVASLLTANRSDQIALWIFRVWSALALGGAVAFAMATARTALPRIAAAPALVAILIVTDAKTIDYTINGMETAFLLLFAAWSIWALVRVPERQWVHLGLAWAGLMWTRPDAFIYIGALLVGALLFGPGGFRAERLKPWLMGAALGAVTYLPWLVWAWWYYGTPIPHTILAKGLFLPSVTPSLVAHWLWTFPGKLWTEPAILAGTFMPAYSHGTGWPQWLEVSAACVTLVAMLLWLVPQLRWEARMASLGVLAGQFYLYSFVTFPVPWYLPIVAFLACLAIGLALGQVAGAVAEGASVPAWRSRVSRLAKFVAGALALGAAGVAGATAWHLRCQQAIVEDGTRTPVGQWLRAHAASTHDTVFLEPLGYIGFFSNLKMLDYPGLGAPEVVAARRRATSRSYPFSWSELILDLQPDWLVLRPFERDSIQGREPVVFSRFYERVQTFDHRAAVESIRFLPGRGYLLHDSCFEIYRRRPGLPAGVSLRYIGQAALTRLEGWNGQAYETGTTLFAHAPSRLAFETKAGSRWIEGGFGFRPDAYTPPAATDGARFTVTHVAPDGTLRVLLDRSLAPVEEARDRGLQPFKVELPGDGSGRVELEIDPGSRGSNAFDWTYWENVLVESPRPPVRRGRD